MPNKRAPLNAFSPEFLQALRERDEMEASLVEGESPLVLRESEGRFALFRSWRSFEAGDVPEAMFETREDALVFLVARGALSRRRRYELAPIPGGHVADGFKVEAWGRPVGWLRTFDPDWVSSASTVASVARSSEDLAMVMEVSGPTRQEEVGEILARQILPRGAESGPGGEEA